MEYHASVVSKMESANDTVTGPVYGTENSYQTDDVPLKNVSSPCSSVAPTLLPYDRLPGCASSRLHV